MRPTLRRRLLRGAYVTVMHLLSPVLLYHLVWRGLRQREYLQRWGERFGVMPGPTRPGALWVHAVSVGEVNAAVPLVNAMRQRWPDRPVVVTTMTPTGSARVAAIWGDKVEHVYCPYDLPWAVSAFLAHYAPVVGVIMETELWPSLLSQADDHGVPLLVVNARLSARSLRGYRLIRPLVGLALDAVWRIAAQSRADAERYVRLGAAPERVLWTGNLKFDQPLAPGLAEQGRAWRAGWGAQRPVWIAASTHPDEEPLVLAAHAALRRAHPDALLLWAPRHPERFRAAAEAAADAGFALRERRAHGLPDAGTEVFVIDTLGELMGFFACADLAFVGGSLQPIGGHNVLEPAALGVPALVGPHTHNFIEITDQLEAVGALLRVEDGPALARQLAALLEDPARRARMGVAGLDLLEKEKGALARTLDLVTTAVAAGAAREAAATR
jgi:3-deoxy-D-manno-octulosonic-acid transferase